MFRHLTGKEREQVALVRLLFDVMCFFSHGVVVSYAICDYGISWSYSLPFSSALLYILS